MATEIEIEVYCEACGEDCERTYESPYGDRLCKECHDQAERLASIEEAELEAEDAEGEVSQIEEEIADLRRQFEEDLKEARERLQDARRAARMARARLAKLS